MSMPARCLASGIRAFTFCRPFPTPEAWPMWRGGRWLKSVRVLLYFRALECQNCYQIVVKELARGFHPVAGN
jgi:hypothetical protein